MKGKKETEFKDTKYEVDCLFLGVEQCQARLEQWTQKEVEASEIVAGYPAKSVKQKTRFILLGNCLRHIQAPKLNCQLLCTTFIQDRYLHISHVKTHYNYYTRTAL